MKSEKEETLCQFRYHFWIILESPTWSSCHVRYFKVSIFYFKQSMQQQPFSSSSDSSYLWEHICKFGTQSIFWCFHYAAASHSKWSWVYYFLMWCKTFPNSVVSYHTYLIGSTEPNLKWVTLYHRWTERNMVLWRMIHKGV